MIFDNDTYKNYLESLKKKDRDHDSDRDDDGWDNDDWGDIGGGGGGFRRLVEEGKEENDNITYRNTDFTNYIFERFNDSINIDKTYRNISDKLSAGYYLGFKDYAAMNEFNNLGLYNLYFIQFPNEEAFVFGCILLGAFVGLGWFYIYRLLYKDKPNDDYDHFCVTTIKILIIIPYSIFYLGFFIYYVYEYCKIYKIRKHDEIIEIKADPFIEDLLKEIYDNNPTQNWIFDIIILYVVSLVIYVIAWILSHHFTKKYLNLLENSKKTKNNSEDSDKKEVEIELLK